MDINELPNKLKLHHPTGQLSGKVRVPGSKSESNRLLLLQKLYFPKLDIKGLSSSEDTLTMKHCLADRGNFIHVGDAGTVMRFLIAYYAVQEGREFVVQGSERMHQRPIGTLAEALAFLGSDIEYLGTAGYPPLKIRGRKLRGGKVEIDAGVSSQFVSALMMIAPCLTDGLVIQLKGYSISAPYIYLTANLMRQLGFTVDIETERIVIQPGVPEALREISVEPDWSGASYWYLMASLSEAAEIWLPGFKEKSLQGDASVNGFFESLGVHSNIADNTLQLTKSPIHLVPSSVNLIHHPDLAQTMAVAFAAHNIPAHISGLQTLRLKETDRLVALKTELEKTGAQIEIGEDYLKVHTGIQKVDHIEFATYGDHRMALSLAPLALWGPIVIENPRVVAKSYPNYWHSLQDLGFKLEKF